MITGATISSKAVIEIINDALERGRPALEAVAGKEGAMKQTTPHGDLVRGIWRENPVLVQMLGLCPALAVTNTVENSLAMGLATFFVLFGSSFLVSLAQEASSRTRCASRPTS